MQKKSERVPELTRRDCGELAANNPKLPVTALTWILKRLWAEGHKQGHIAKVTGAKKDYVKKHTACFSRALGGVAAALFREEKREIYKKTSAIKREEKEKEARCLKRKGKCKRLVVNFTAPVHESPYPQKLEESDKDAYKIYFKSGGFCLVDFVDFIRLSPFVWYPCRGHKTSYAFRVERKTKRRIWMHRQILALTDAKEFTDHINGNGLDNRRCNLRKCTHAENQRNQGVNRRNRSGFKGVSWARKSKKWRAQIKVDGKSVHLGEFHLIRDAIEAYNGAAIKFHGDFAYLNQLPKTQKDAC